VSESGRLRHGDGGPEEATAAGGCPATSTSAAPPVETYGRLPAIDFVSLSPSGDRFALAARDGENRSLFVRRDDGQAEVATRLQPGKVRDLVWGGDETLVVVSSDLSHYHDYATAQALDARTAAAIVAGDAMGIADDDACGARPIRGLLVAARRHDLGVRLLDLRSSGDTAGDRERVVGYGAFALSSRPPS